MLLIGNDRHVRDRLLLLVRHHDPTFVLVVDGQSFGGFRTRGKQVPPHLRGRLVFGVKARILVGEIEEGGVLHVVAHVAELRPQDGVAAGVLEVFGARFGGARAAEAVDEAAGDDVLALADVVFDHGDTVALAASGEALGAVEALGDLEESGHGHAVFIYCRFQNFDLGTTLFIS